MSPARYAVGTSIVPLPGTASMDAATHSAGMRRKRLPRAIPAAVFFRSGSSGIIASMMLKDPKRL